jgi:glutamine cyclotransferase
VVNQRQIVLLSPRNNEIFNPDQDIPLELEFRREARDFDSLQLSLKEARINSFVPGEQNISFRVQEPMPGTNSFILNAFVGDSIAERLSFRIRFTSGIDPDRYSYRVIRTYPHDIGAFTQGFEYHEGFMYEGTGNRGESSLRKVELETGEILKFRNLDAELFGEGITIINDKIYQVTYTSQVGFVYNKNSFEELRRIYYQNREGWGLTNNGSEILMSDGSHVIYYMDTTYFSVQRKIEVFDNNGPVDNLNELELIDGQLYANRYTFDEIVIIDPETGRLTGRIDMSGLLDPVDRHPRIDFLNGIAWDREQDRIFVTGKRWPKVYQVEFIRK